MNSLTNTLKMAAVTLTVAAGCASAQGLKAEIPFTFKAGSAVLPAGSYTVMESSGMRYLRLRNDETRKSVLLMPVYSSDAANAWRADEKPKLAFLCGNGRCALQQAWNGHGLAHQFATPRFGNEIKTRIAVITMHRDLGE